MEFWTGVWTSLLWLSAGAFGLLAVYILVGAIKGLFEK